MKLLLAIGFMFLSVISASAQQTEVVQCEVITVGKPYADKDAKIELARCYDDGRTILTKGAKFTITLPLKVPNVDCKGTWTETSRVLGACVNNTQTVTVTEVFNITTKPSGSGLACPASPKTTVTSQACTTPPPDVKIWGVVDMTPDIFGRTVLGECSAAVHDKHILPGDNNDGWFYRTWHPQTDPTGCVYGHNHGDNPNNMLDKEVLSHWDGRFGMMAHFLNHEEAHEGFKVTVANLGDKNNDGFTNRMPTIAYNHMGTFRVKRFTTKHHSHSISWVLASDRSFFASYHVMVDTGDTGVVCDPRTPAPVKDVMALDQAARCGRKLNSSYEIWSQQIRFLLNGSELYRGFATPAVFDVITIFNPLDVNETIYVWDPRVNQTMMAFNDDRTWHRGCRSEAYAQSGYFFNTTGQTEFWTDSHGNLGAQSPVKSKVRLGLKNTGGGPGLPFASEIQQFKKVADFCGQWQKLSVKN